jgi:hypothetical protein
MMTGIIHVLAFSRMFFVLQRQMNCLAEDGFDRFLTHCSMLGIQTGFGKAIADHSPPLAD